MKTHKNHMTPKQAAKDLVRIHLNIIGGGLVQGRQQALNHSMETAKLLTMFTRLDDVEDRPKTPFDKEYWLEVIKELKKWA